MRGHEGAALDTMVRSELRERQKHELRGERNRVVLALADSLGVDRLADSLGTNRATAETLVLRARQRVADGPRKLVARRLSRDPDRWGEADRHYEVLGRSVRLP
jgi:hypothetical protein